MTQAYSTLRVASGDDGVLGVVLESADPDYFVPHVDLTKVAEYTEARTIDMKLEVVTLPLARGVGSPGHTDQVTVIISTPTAS